jgi:hypothetical protein
MARRIRFIYKKVILGFRKRFKICQYHIERWSSWHAGAYGSKGGMIGFSKELDHLLEVGRLVFCFEVIMLKHRVKASSVDSLSTWITLSVLGFSCFLFYTYVFVKFL